MSITTTKITSRTQKFQSGKNQTPMTPISFEELPKELREGIEESLRDVDAGRVTPHEEVFRKINEWLKNN